MLPVGVHCRTGEFVVDYHVMSGHVPVRSCVACRTRRPQQQLLRVVRTPAGDVEVDCGRPHRAGRGGYLCPAEACIARAERGQLLARRLRRAVPDTIYTELRAQADRATCETQKT